MNDEIVSIIEIHDKKHAEIRGRIYELEKELRHLRTCSRFLDTKKKRSLVSALKKKYQGIHLDFVPFTTNTTKEIPIKDAVLEAWNGVCAYCKGAHRFMELNHVIPRFLRGSDRVPNRVPACRVCNGRKGHKDVHDFLLGSFDSEDYANERMFQLKAWSDIMTWGYEVTRQSRYRSVDLGGRL